MFKLFHKPFTVLYSPVIGEAIPLEKINDKVFSNKLLGDGIAFQFRGSNVYSPCDAKVIMVANTNHAIGIKQKDVEILIHVGLETVNLRGQGLKVHVKEGDTIKKGDLILTIDREFMESMKIDLTTPMIITSKDVKISEKKFGEVTLETKVLNLF